jgi:hypothetical protein
MPSGDYLAAIRFWGVVDSRGQHPPCHASLAGVEKPAKSPPQVRESIVRRCDAFVVSTWFADGPAMLEARVDDEVNASLRGDAYEGLNKAARDRSPIGVSGS